MANRAVGAIFGQLASKWGQSGPIEANQCQSSPFMENIVNFVQHLNSIFNKKEAVIVGPNRVHALALGVCRQNVMDSNEKIFRT